MRVLRGLFGRPSLGGGHRDEDAAADQGQHQAAVHDGMSANACLICAEEVDSNMDRAVWCRGCHGPAHRDCFPPPTNTRRGRPSKKQKRDSWLCGHCEGDGRKAGLLRELLPAVPDTESSHSIFSQPLLTQASRRGGRLLRNKGPREASKSAVTLVHIIQRNPTSLILRIKARPADKRGSEKPFGGLLTQAQADTSMTIPEGRDRQIFDRVKQGAVERVLLRKMELQAKSQGMKRGEEGHVTAHPGANAASKIKFIHFGDHEIDTWYSAPYPEEYSRNRILYICEFCLKYIGSDFVAWRHRLKCPVKHPPGDEIYRDSESHQGEISIFEVDGRKNALYCQNLCLMAKMFLGSKTLYYDVEPFFFYVMTEMRAGVRHFVGYFSKEKRSTSGYNVSCILTLPIHQRKGYGNLLIDFSYLLSRTEGKVGSPEKPLSDLGLVSYRNYWKTVLARHLYQQHDAISLAEISRATSMTYDDVISGLEGLHALIRDPVTGMYALRIDHAALEAHVLKVDAKTKIRLDPDKLLFSAWVPGRGLQHDGPGVALPAKAPVLPAAPAKAAASPASKPAKAEPLRKRKRERKEAIEIDMPATPPSSEDERPNPVPLGRFVLAAPGRDMPEDLSRTRSAQRQREQIADPVDRVPEPDPPADLALEVELDEEDEYVGEEEEEEEEEVEETEDSDSDAVVEAEEEEESA